MKNDLVVQWQRFWCPRDGSIRFGEDGFLIDPSTEWGSIYNPDIEPIDLLTEAPCLVLLGEPGIGKSTTLKVERERISAGSAELGIEFLWLDLHEVGSDTQLSRRLFDDPKFESWKLGNSVLHLFLDSLDECRVQVNTLPSLLLHELRQEPIEHLNLRIACRTADWPAPLEQGLVALWGKDAVKVFELAPLRRADIELAARQRSVEPHDFLAAVAKVGAQSLAIKPLTLDFLLRMFARDGGLPPRQADLYYKGCRLLCDESPGRQELRLSNVLETEERLAVAKRIAALTVFANRAAIATGQDRGDFFEQDLPIDDLIGGKEEENGSQFTVGTRGVEEALNTGLFSSRGEERLGWAHRTYEEYLAARYLIDRNAPLPQILSLIVGTDGKIVPQLRETAAWLATMRPDVFREILAHDFEVLLRSDMASASESDRAALVSTLLRACDSGEWVARDWRLNQHYAKLNYPDLRDQLRPYIIDPSKGTIVRRVAIRIAEACKVTDLVGDLVNLALDPGTPLETRVTAGFAVADMGDSASRRLLLPLIEATAEEDPDEELKGVGLRAVWPEHLSVEEFLRALTRPRRSSLLGAYRSFLYGNPVDQIPEKDLPLALKWALAQPSTVPPDDIGRLVESIIRRAWENVEVPGVLDELGVILALRLGASDPLFSDENSELLGNARKRRLILNRMVSLATSDGEIYDLLGSGLVSSEDAFWMVQQYESSPKNEKQGWALLLSRTMLPSDHEALEAAWIVCESDRRLHESLSAFFGAVELGSDEEIRQRKAYELFHKPRKIEYSEDHSVEPSIQEVIANQIAQFESGNLPSWWILNRTLRFEASGTIHRHELESDLTTLPGWQNASEETRKSLTKAAETFIREYNPEPDRWMDLGSQWFYAPDFAGFRAFRLLQAENPIALDVLSQEVWRKWAPVIVAYPEFDSGGEDGWHQRLVAQTYGYAPVETLAAVQRCLRNELKEQTPSINGLLQQLRLAWDERIANTLLAEAQDPTISSTALNQLLSVLLDHGSKAATSFALSLVPSRPPRKKQEFERVALVTALLFTHAPTTSWPTIYPLLRRSKRLADRVFGRIAGGYRREERILMLLTVAQLFDLYVLLSGFYPHCEDPKLEGYGQITDRMEIGHWRDTVLTELKLRGTEEACRALEKLVKALPAQYWLRWTLQDARAIHRQQSWIPLKPAVIVKLVQSPNQRLVQSADQLLDVVVESLRRLEQDLQLNEPPAAIDLWDEIGKNRFRPKDEERLSDYIKRHLDKDLRGREVVSNREVVNRPGEETDIRVEAFLRDAAGERHDLLTVIVEVKGCWNSERYSAMGTQLVDRYLHDATTKHGLYVVGYFNSDRWDPDDWRYKKAPKATKEQFQHRLDQQAMTLSENGVTIRSLVLDTSLRY